MKTTGEQWKGRQLFPVLKNRLWNAAGALVEKLRAFGSRIIFIERNEL